MGKRLENSKKRVTENVRGRLDLNAQREQLQAEFEPMAVLDSLRAELDCEVSDAVDTVASVKGSEEMRIAAENAQINEEKERITHDINAEIKKLHSGLTSLKQMDAIAFGQKAKDKAKNDYKGTIDSFESLLEELGEESGQKHGRSLPENRQYVVDTLDTISEELQDSFDRQTIIAGAAGRSLNTPSTHSNDGTAKGHWDEDVFFFEDDYIPSNFNQDQLRMGEIKNTLREKYDITLDGIPYHNGVADFSSVSLVHLDTADIAMASAEISRDQFEEMSQRDRIFLYQEVFSGKTDNKSKRNTNFHIADTIAAERQIPVPGLEIPYSASDLQRWRSENHFTWDEQLSSGYNLVPSVIHGNLSHSGLVSTSGNAYAEITRTERILQDNPELLSWDEESAPISIDDFLKRFNP